MFPRRWLPLVIVLLVVGPGFAVAPPQPLTDAQVQQLAERARLLEALRQAQLFVLRNPGKVRAGTKGTSPPLWWAGWVLSGNP